MRTEYEQLSTRIKKDESNQTKSLETLIQEVMQHYNAMYLLLYTITDLFTSKQTAIDVPALTILYVQVDRYKQVSSTAEKKLAALEQRNKELLASIASSPRCTYGHHGVRTQQ
jgi:hypothetical protein